MSEDYQIAKRMGESAAKAALKEGKSPYLPVLDAIPEIKDSVGEAYIGVLERSLRRCTYRNQVL